MSYGDKRDYKRIDLILDGRYVATTTWSRTCKEAKAIALKNAPVWIDPKRLKAQFSKADK